MMRLTKPMAYGILVLSVISEQLGTACLGASETFTRLVPTLILIFAYFFSYWSLSKILKLINLSVVYATWNAVGTVGAALMGVYLFHQHLTPIGWVSIFVMVTGVAILNIFGTPKEKTEEATDDLKKKQEILTDNEEEEEIAC